MIFRYKTLCPGCNAKTILRLSMGIDDFQPFFLFAKNVELQLEVL